MNSEWPRVSIVIPVRNEEAILGRCLESIASLDYPSDRVEVIIADGFSTDGSRSVAERFGARLVCNRGQTVVSGRNCGFRLASGEIVAFTDADCIVREDWLTSAVGVFRSDERIAGVGGVTRFPDDATSFQEAVNLLFRLAGMAGATAHLQATERTEPVEDIPGCNALYRREALAAVMPVDERLLTAEDVWMNWSLRQRGHVLALARDTVVWHHRRSRPRGFFRQIYRFAIGRLQVGKRARGLLNPWHVLAGLSIPLLVAVAGALLWTGHGVALLAGAAGAALVLGLAALPKVRSTRAALWFPPVVATFAVAWSAGFLRELVVPLVDADGK
jgi:cellulose synthase/poly-beta-1,6-N-acetylglucosamine synthase-like glycosyltransferase